MQSIMKRHLFYFFLFSALAACKKDNPGPDQVDPTGAETTMEMKVGGQDISLDKNKIQALYYADGDEPTGAMEVNAQLPDGGRMIFFLDETKAKTIQLTQKFPAVIGLSASGCSGLSITDERDRESTRLNSIHLK